MAAAFVRVRVMVIISAIWTNEFSGDQMRGVCCMQNNITLVCPLFAA